MVLLAVHRSTESIPLRVTNEGHAPKCCETGFCVQCLNPRGRNNGSDRPVAGVLFRKSVVLPPSVLEVGRLGHSGIIPNVLLPQRDRDNRRSFDSGRHGDLCSR